MKPLASARTDAAHLDKALTVADAITQQVYFASGAFESQERRRKEVGDPTIFAKLALPLLDGIGHVRHPAVTHHIVETAEHLSSAQPKPALHLALQAVTEDHGYVAESLGVDAVIKLINTYMANHRELVLQPHFGLAESALVVADPGPVLMPPSPS